MPKKPFKFMFVFFNDRMRTNIPLNIAYLTASLKEAGFSTFVFDTSFYKEHERIHEERKKEEAGIFLPVDYSSIGVGLKKGPLIKDLISAIAQESPDIIGFSVFSQAKHQNFQLARQIKDAFPRIPIIMGGTHINIEPQEVLAKDFVDYICLGEGERAVVELAQKLMEGKGAEGVRNIGYKRDGRIVLNPLRPPMDLDDLPFIDYESFEPYHQYGPFRGRLLKMALVEGSRTCPYGCTYCGNRIFHPHYEASNHVLRYRHKSPMRWVKELKYYKEKYGVEFFNIADGTYVAQKTEVFEELAPLYLKEVGLPFFCDATVHCLNPRKVELLKKMGCVCVNIGLEIGSEEYRQKHLGRTMTNERIIQAFHMVNDAGIESRSYNILGLPYQTRKEIFESIELNRLCKVKSLSLSIFMPYEGTKMRDFCIREGLMPPEADISGDGTQPIIKNPYLSDQEILGLYRTFALYVFSPRKLFPIIRLAEEDGPFSSHLRRELLKIYG